MRCSLCRLCPDVGECRAGESVGLALSAKPQQGPFPWEIEPDDGKGTFADGALHCGRPRA